MYKPYYDRVFALPHTINPDKLARSGKKAVVEGFTGKRVLMDSMHTIELYTLQGNPHNQGMVVVYLPKEKIVATGDFFEGPVTGALNFGFHDEWAINLEKLKALDFETVVPGHGEPFRGKEQIAYFQAFLRDLWNQTKTLHYEKVPVADAAKRIDLTAHREHYRNVNGPGIQEATVARIYQVLDQRSGSN